MTQEKVYYEWIDMLKGWGILFIVLGHIVGSLVHLTDGLLQCCCVWMYKYIYSFHVPLFFFIAGLTFRQHTLGDFLAKKWNRLLLPYFTFGLFSILIYVLVGEVALRILQHADVTGYYDAKGTMYSIPRWILGLVLGGWKSDVFLVNSVLWFIPVLFSLELIIQVSSRVLKSSVLIGVVGILVLVGLPFYESLLPTLPWGGNRVFRYLPYFLLGVLFKQIQLRGTERRIWLLTSFILLGCGTGVIISPFTYFVSKLGPLLLSFLLTGGNIIGWWFVSHIFTVDYIVRVGRASLVIMLFHKFPVICILNVLLPALGIAPVSLLLLLLSIGVSSIGAVEACLLVYRLGVRFCPSAIGMNDRNFQK